MRGNILEVKDLKIDIETELGVVNAVRGVDLTLEKGETLAIIGETGCGKTILCRGILGILPKNAYIKQGSITIEGKKSEELNIKDISMIFQNPMTALNPSMKIGEQILEAIILKRGLKKKEAKEEVIKFMELVGIENPRERYNSRPYEFSGGMRQRVVIAIALSTHPKILIADEPTTALDVTVQKQILNLIKDLQKRLGLSIIFITHDLSVVYNIANKVVVMYAGKIIEEGATRDIFEEAAHPYTKALLGAIPKENDKMLVSLEGAPPSLINIGDYDAFALRNKEALKIDFKEHPPMFTISKTHKVATWTLHPLAKKYGEGIVEGL